MPRPVAGGISGCRGFALTPAHGQLPLAKAGNRVGNSDSVLVTTALCADAEPAGARPVGILQGSAGEGAFTRRAPSTAESAVGRSPRSLAGGGLIAGDQVQQFGRDRGLPRQAVAYLHFFQLFGDGAVGGLHRHQPLDVFGGA